MTRFARVIPNTAGTVGRDPRTLFPWASLSFGLAMGGSSENTAVMLEVSCPLRPFLTMAAMGHVWVFVTGATLTSDGVSLMLRESFEKYKSYLK